MKNWIGAGCILILTLGGMLFSAKLAAFIDFPSLVLVAGIGGISVYFKPEKGGRAFMEAAWLIFGIGIVAGMAQLGPDATIQKFAMNLSITAISVVYGYLIGIVYDLLAKKTS